MAFYMNMMALNEARTKEEYEKEKADRKKEELNKDYMAAAKRTHHGLGTGMANIKNPPGEYNSNQAEANKQRAAKADELASKAMAPKKKDYYKDPNSDVIDDGMRYRADKLRTAGSIERHMKKEEKRSAAKQESCIFDECYFLDEE